MFKTRLLSGIVLIIIAMVTIISGGDVLFVTTLLIALIGLSELYKIAHLEKKLLGITGYLTTVAYFVLIRSQNKGYLMYLIMAFLIILMIEYVISFPKYKADDIMITFFGLFYVTIMLSYIYQTRMLVDGVYLVWLIFICSWGCDTCAYCVGMLLGKHKMAPKLSPKKSIEGAIGGIVGAAGLAVLYVLVIGDSLQGTHSVAMYALVGAIGAVISQIGDLAASAIKRNHDIKDYGTLIPGHGGILDRFDSVIFTAPVIYLLAVVMIRIA